MATTSARGSKKAASKKSAAKKGSTRGRKSSASKTSDSDGPTRETPAKKSPAKKSPAKKSPAKKSPAKKSSSQSDRATRDGRTTAKTEARPRAKASSIASSAAEELLALTGREVEGVTGLERTDDGWTVQVEVLEVRRIPDTTDVLALYEVSTDSSGSMLGYRRLRRYIRGTPGEE